MTHPRLQSHLPLSMSTSNPCALHRLNPSDLWEMEISESPQIPSSLLRSSAEMPRGSALLEVHRVGKWDRHSEKGLHREKGSSVPPLGPARATSVAELQKWPPAVSLKIWGRSGQMEPAHETDQQAEGTQGGQQSDKGST